MLPVSQELVSSGTQRFLARPDGRSSIGFFGSSSAALNFAAVSAVRFYFIFTYIPFLCCLSLCIRRKPLVQQRNCATFCSGLRVFTQTSAHSFFCSPCSGVECLVGANVPTIKGGATNATTVKKYHRIDQIATENRLPSISMVETAGADLTQQAQVFHNGGRIFQSMTKRSQLGIPTVSVVFGSSTAGGAYTPGLSDYVVMVKKQAKV